MRILHIGDIVGKPGRRIVRQSVPALREREGIDFVLANGENSAGGTGITPENFRELMKCQVDCVSLGDHIYRRKQIAEILEKDHRIVKPANFPQEAPGKPWTVVEAKNGVKVGVISLIGRVFMKPVDCPWAAVDKVLEEMPSDVKVILVDFHAEATSDKQIMGRYLDGKVSSVLGTHTHVPTADETVFPGGTAFQCDIGMTGPYESILGRRIDRVTYTTRTMYPSQFDVAEDDVRLMGTIVDIDVSTGRATDIRRLCVRQEEAEKFSR
ncbi:MAG: TIGR00282 family metallophosphoesterase [Planctomycetota bacterium]